ncbi:MULTISPECIES: TerB family tellurite resistance protein [unclassified Leisingera]|uniref:tellurite resistance TerB family protein n=1 Tax=unclassified Leisingera TaxID=2614906 RepID=UPI001011D0F9|nr:MULTISPECIES: TerB family tellurite resistance protein [unclassified Leisingera]MBQ4826922.1 TerB family tellurite resistance protein [Leisingera sp. HS039]MCF6429834.1 TerB family tellurite resistance protein [Leisingera sp. MMG026]QAX30017.1 TerB family tellurite resistance protein [Leisingera sp. NJS204]QBR36744.1 TerB family tellurite resistance protein [Leisingera sp. NJS201]
MFKELLQRLLDPAPAPLDDEGARLALTALLVRIARSDHNYSEVEKDRIDRILCTRYRLDTGGALILREQAEAMEAEAPDTVRFTRAIKDAVAYEDRTGVIEALWQVALADGHRDANEDALLRLSASLLGVSDVDSAMARKRAEAGL